MLLRDNGMQGWSGFEKEKYFSNYPGIRVRVLHAARGKQKALLRDNGMQGWSGIENWRKGHDTVTQKPGPLILKICN